MSENKGQDIELDDKTAAVFHRKGYKILSALGFGSYGRVYKAKKEDSDEFVAVKVMDLEKVSSRFKEKFLPRELAALIEVKHKNVIQVHDIFQSNKKIYIFMEFAGNGDLSGYLKKHGALQENLACVWFTQVADALNFVHTEVYWAHRDVKLSNILLSEDNVVKLTDFRLAKQAYDQESKKVILSETFCGTEPYFCPQILCKKAYDPFASDVWALGVVLFVMLNKKFPFEFGNKHLMLNQELDTNHLKKRYVKEFSRNVRNLMERMMDPIEKTRITMNDVLKQKWVINKGK